MLKHRSKCRYSSLPRVKQPENQKEIPQQQKTLFHRVSTNQPAVLVCCKKCCFLRQLSRKTPPKNFFCTLQCRDMNEGKTAEHTYTCQTFKETVLPRSLKSPCNQQIYVPKTSPFQSVLRNFQGRKRQDQAHVEQTSVQHTRARQTEEKMKQMYLVLSDHAANSLENNFIKRPTPSTECQVTKLQSIIVRHVIAGPCFRDPIAPEELTKQHVRVVPSVVVPQFHDEALQTHLFTRRALQTHLCVNRGTKALRPKMDKSWRGSFVFTLQTTSITKYSRIYGQEVQPSRSFSTNEYAVHPSRSTHEFKSNLSIHHEVFQKPRLAIHPSRSTHELLLLLLLFVVVSGGIQTLASGGFKIAPHAVQLTQ